ncbi:MAG: HD domain-containing protein [Pirellulaceae bacterium]
MIQSTIEQAREFAIAAHAGQRYGGNPYSYHLDAVVEILKNYGHDAQVIGYLHDVVEDTDVVLGDIRSHFGDDVAEAVSLLTDEPGEDRETRKQRTNAKLSRSSNSLALIVKVADRLTNIRESQKDPTTGKLSMYRLEHEAFRAAAYRAGLCDTLWLEMDQILRL